MSVERSTKPLERIGEITRFGISGVATELVYFGLLWVLGWWLDVPLWWRATLAYLGSIVVNYTMQRTYTFRSNRAHTYAGPRYLVVHAVGLGINSGVLGLTVDLLAWPFIPSQVLAIGLVAVWSYFGQKRWAF